MSLFAYYQLYDSKLLLHLISLIEIQLGLLDLGVKFSIKYVLIYSNYSRCMYAPVFDNILSVTEFDRSLKRIH